MARLKTGTPPRLDGRTIDWASLPEQPSDDDSWTMSELSTSRVNPQIFCAITRTTMAAHEVIRDNLHRSPLFSGAIGAAGIPGSGLIMMVLVFSAVKVPLDTIALVAGIDRIMDMMRTTTNVSGDAAVATTVASLTGEIDQAEMVSADDV